MAEKKRPVFDFSLCVSCGICVQSCPVSCIALTERAGKDDNNLYPTAGEDCIGCMMCQHTCPMNAISAGIMHI